MVSERERGRTCWLQLTPLGRAPRGRAGLQSGKNADAPASNARAMSYPRLCIVSSLLLAACASTPKEPEEPKERMQVTAYNSNAMRTQTTLGAYLGQLDRSIQSWNAMFLSGDRVRDAHTLRSLSVDIGHRAGKLYYELVETLETSPAPQNRSVAAAALGFVHTQDALTPLLNALSDVSVEVRANALLALAILGDPKTPLGGVVQAMQLGLTEEIRANAALAVLEVLRAGGTPTEGLVDAARLGLHDDAPLVRTQCALILAHQDDEISIDDLALQLYHDTVNTAAMAAGRALAYLGSRNLRVKGRCARALAASLTLTNATVKASILEDLRKLARANFADEEAWVEWAHRLD